MLEESKIDFTKCNLIKDLLSQTDKLPTFTSLNKAKQNKIKKDIRELGFDVFSRFTCKSSYFENNKVALLAKLNDTNRVNKNFYLPAINILHSSLQLNSNDVANSPDLDALTILAFLIFMVSTKVSRTVKYDAIHHILDGTVKSFESKQKFTLKTARDLWCSIAYATDYINTLPIQQHKEAQFQNKDTNKQGTKPTADKNKPKYKTSDNQTTNKNSSSKKTNNNP